MSEQRSIYQVLYERNYVILDTETTGLSRPAEICQLAIVDCDGKPYINTLLQTFAPIPLEASRIHGITTEMCYGAPTWPDIKPSVSKALYGKDVIVYNANFDRFMMHLSDEMWGLPKTNYSDAVNWYCAMLWYADLWQDWDEYHGNNRWQKLSQACIQQGVSVDSTHDALRDCLLTYSLIQACIKHYRIVLPHGIIGDHQGYYEV